MPKLKRARHAPRAPTTPTTPKAGSASRHAALREELRTWCVDRRIGPDEIDPTELQAWCIKHKVDPTEARRLIEIAARHGGRWICSGCEHCTRSDVGAVRDARPARVRRLGVSPSIAADYGRPAHATLLGDNTDTGRREAELARATPEVKLQAARDEAKRRIATRDGQAAKQDPSRPGNTKQGRASASTPDRQATQIADDLAAARAEAARRIATRDRFEARAVFYEALLTTAKDALATIFKPPPDASDRERAALEQQRLEIEDTLEGAWLALPPELDEQAVEAQIAAGTAGDVDFEPVTKKTAFSNPRESLDDVTARVLVERGYSETSAIALVRELTSADATNSAARRTLRRSRTQEREWQQPRPGEPSAREQAEMDEVIRQTEPEREARLARQSARWRAALSRSSE